MKTHDPARDPATRVAPPSGPAAGDGARPWWSYGHVWMVIAGPAAVVVAGITTAVIAVRNPDPVTDQNYYRHGLEVNRTLAAQKGVRAMMPAMQGRNHAATPPADAP